MNTPPPSPSEVLEMRQFLARVVRTPIMAIKITGDPATDENADLLISHTKSDTELSMEKLCPMEAMEIDGKLEDPKTQTEGARLFEDYLAQRQPLYP